MTSTRSSWLILLVSLTVIAHACSSDDPSDLPGSEEQTRSPQQFAYDEGFIYAGPVVCEGWESAFSQPEVKDSLPSETLESLVDGWNGYLLRTLTESGMSGEEALSYMSGMWDSAGINCPEWFERIELVGRPGGEGVQAVALSARIDPTVLTSLASSSEVPSEPFDPLEIPRAPTSDEIEAILDLYDDMGASNGSPDSFRKFWARRNHPGLGCARQDFKDVLLPEPGDPSWDDRTRFEPRLESLSRVFADDSLGLYVTLERENVTISPSGREFRDGFVTPDTVFLVDGMAYMFIIDCGGTQATTNAAGSPSTDSATGSALSDPAALIARIHESDPRAALLETVAELIAPNPILNSEEKYLQAMRWAWPKRSADDTDAELLAQAESVCADLDARGPQAVLFSYPGNEITFHSGHVRCRDQSTWQEWVLLVATIGFDEYFDNYLGVGEAASGYAVAFSDGQWQDFIGDMVRTAITMPALSPYLFGQIHGMGAARVAASVAD